MIDFQTLLPAKKKVWRCGFSLSLAQLAQAISGSPISSDVLLSDATIVFVLDIVLALIINCSNYSWALSFPLETMRGTGEAGAYTRSDTEAHSMWEHR